MVDPIETEPEAKLPHWGADKWVFVIGTILAAIVVIMVVLYVLGNNRAGTFT